MPSPYENSILRSLRRIIRATDSHSRYLASNFGLTGPQLVCLRVLAQKGEMSLSSLAKEVSLSQGTITGIVDRLLARDLISKVRGSVDRRKSFVAITPGGSEMIRRAPSPMQEQFAERLAELPEENQIVIDAVLQQIVKMMGAGDVDAAPMLTSGSTSDSAGEVKQYLDDRDDSSQ